MTLRGWAAGYAEELLAPLGDRWAHVQGVVRQAQEVAAILPTEEREVLVAAAYLHDLGYAPALVETGFHALDGARTLARQVGVGEAGLRRLVRISYAKVAEFQRRGAIHFHAVIRLDLATTCRCPACLLPPPEPFGADLLEDALKKAVPAVTVPCPPLDDGGPARYACWGGQIDVRNISKDSDQAGELSAEQVAGYIAKYATKATESFGSGLDRRLTAADDLERLDQLPDHVAELVKAAWELGGRPELESLRLRAWAHMLGFRGHWSTKSRRYSTTFTVLRRARVAFAQRRCARDAVPLDAWGRPEDDQIVTVVASWVYVGSGYETEGERWLALSAAARAREERRIAREELGTTTMAA
jgi:hypothetical protein